VARFNATSGEFLGVFARGAAGDVEGPGASQLQKFFYQRKWMTQAERQVAVMEAQRASHDGGAGEPAHLLIGPEDIAFTRQGDLLVTSFFTDRVLRFDGETGAPRGILGDEANGTVAGPVGVCVGAGGHIYVAAHRTDQIVQFDGRSGKYLGIFASGGGMQGPSGLAFSPDNTLFVTGHLNDMIARFNGTTGVSWSFGSEDSKSGKGARILGR